MRALNVRTYIHTYIHTFVCVWGDLFTNKLLAEVLQGKKKAKGTKGSLNF